MEHKIELLYFTGCPGYEQLRSVVQALATEVGAELVLREIDTPEAAREARFLGSPTVRVNGRDVDPDAEQRSDYGLKCRLYRSAESGQSAVPPTAWIRAALASSRPGG
jgi:hypothetical protein